MHALNRCAVTTSLLFVAMAACQGGNRSSATGDSPAGSAVSQSEAGLPALPVTYQGDLPCADCTGIHLALTLLSDSTFRLRRTYGGRPDSSEAAFYDHGRWSVDSAGRTLRLSGGRDSTERFALVSADTLRMLDREGRPIASPLNYTLTRAPSVDSIAEAESAGAQRSPDLFGTEWTLVELDGKPAGTGAEGRAPTLQFTAQGRRVSGFGGCNRLAGTYQIAGPGLNFNPIIMTRMACATGMELERRFAAALEATRRYRISSRGLELLGEHGVLARLEAR